MGGGLNWGRGLLFSGLIDGTEVCGVYSLVGTIVLYVVGNVIGDVVGDWIRGDVVGDWIRGDGGMDSAIVEDGLLEGGVV